MNLSACVIARHGLCIDFYSLAVFTFCLCDCVFVSSVNEMFFRPVDDTRSVWESSSPLSLSSPASSHAYISSIIPVLGGLLWSLCVLWAMVIICLLRSHCFMCLDSLPSLFLSLVHATCLSPSMTLSSVMPHPCPLSLLHFPLLLDTTYFSHFPALSSWCFHFWSSESLLLSLAFTATQMQVQLFNLWKAAKKLR